MSLRASSTQATHSEPNGERDERATPRSYSRRTLLRAALGTSAVALLAACGGAGTTPTTTSATTPTAGSTAPTPARTAATGGAGATTATTGGAATGGAASPATSPRAGSPAAGSSGAASPAAQAVDGKVASTVPGVPDAYTKRPAPFKSYDGKPGRGSKVSVYTIAYQAPPTPRDQNQYWQELEKRLGVTWDPIITPQPDYGAKSAALIASGSLPDLFYLNPGQNAAPQYKAMEQGAFLDLTPYVTGDAVKEFKNLATFPDYAWKNVSFKGKIYGVPKPLQRNGNIAFYRADWAKKIGKDVPNSPDALRDLLVAFAKNDPDANGQPDTWGLARYGGGWAGWDTTLVANNTFGVPFNWRKNPDGTMTNQIETDEYRQALDYLRRLWADGAYHPDSASFTFAQAQGAFLGSKIGMHSEGISNFFSPDVAGSAYFKLRTANPQAELTGLLPTTVGGAKAVTLNTPGSFGFTGIPSTVKDKERVKELLRLLDYLASPFGSEEWLFLNYGLEGVDHQVDANGVLTLTEKGTQERGDLVFVMAGLPALYYPKTPDVAVSAQKLGAEIIKIGLDDPTWPLYSATNVAKAAELGTFGFDQVTAIVTGRQPLSALDTAIKDWKSRGGDQIRQEFQQSLQGQ